MFQSWQSKRGVFVHLLVLFLVAPAYAQWGTGLYPARQACDAAKKVYREDSVKIRKNELLLREKKRLKKRIKDLYQDDLADHFGKDLARGIGVAMEAGSLKLSKVCQGLSGFQDKQSLVDEIVGWNEVISQARTCLEGGGSGSGSGGEGTPSSVNPKNFSPKDLQKAFTSVQPSLRGHARRGLASAFQGDLLDKQKKALEEELEKNKEKQTELRTQLYRITSHRDQADELKNKLGALEFQGLLIKRKELEKDLVEAKKLSGHLRNIKVKQAEKALKALEGTAVSQDYEKLNKELAVVQGNINSSSQKNADIERKLPPLIREYRDLEKTLAVVQSDIEKKKSAASVAVNTTSGATDNTQSGVVQGGANNVAKKKCHVTDRTKLEEGIKRGEAQQSKLRDLQNLYGLKKLCSHRGQLPQCHKKTGFYADIEGSSRVIKNARRLERRSRRGSGGSFSDSDDDSGSLFDGEDPYYDDDASVSTDSGASLATKGVISPRLTPNAIDVDSIPKPSLATRIVRTVTRGLASVVSGSNDDDSCKMSNLFKKACSISSLVVEGHKSKSSGKVKKSDEKGCRRDTADLMKALSEYAQVKEELDDFDLEEEREALADRINEVYQDTLTEAQMCVDCEQAHYGSYGSYRGPTVKPTGWNWDDTIGLGSTLLQGFVGYKSFEKISDNNLSLGYETDGSAGLLAGLTLLHPEGAFNHWMEGRDKRQKHHHQQLAETMHYYKPYYGHASMSRGAARAGYFRCAATAYAQSVQSGGNLWGVGPGSGWQGNNLMGGSINGYPSNYYSQGSGTPFMPGADPYMTLYDGYGAAGPYSGHGVGGPYSGHGVAGPYSGYGAGGPYSGYGVGGPYSGHGVGGPYSGYGVGGPYSGYGVGGPYSGYGVGGPYSGYGVGGPYSGYGVGGPYSGYGVGGPYSGYGAGGPYSGYGAGGPYSGYGVGGPYSGYGVGGPYSGYGVGGQLDLWSQRAQQANLAAQYQLEFFQRQQKQMEKWIATQQLITQQKQQRGQQISLLHSEIQKLQLQIQSIAYSPLQYGQGEGAGFDLSSGGSFLGDGNVSPLHSTRGPGSSSNHGGSLWDNIFQSYFGNNDSTCYGAGPFAKCDNDLAPTRGGDRNDRGSGNRSRFRGRTRSGQ